MRFTEKISKRIFLFGRTSGLSTALSIPFFLLRKKKTTRLFGQVQLPVSCVFGLARPLAFLCRGQVRTAGITSSRYRYLCCRGKFLFGSLSDRVFTVGSFLRVAISHWADCCNVVPSVRPVFYSRFEGAPGRRCEVGAAGDPGCLVLRRLIGVVALIVRGKSVCLVGLEMSVV